MNKPKVIAVVGATASGKTALAIKLAEQFSGEIISADSRQVYRDLNIGTGKVTDSEMKGIPHHLLDIRDLNDSYSGIDFVRDSTTTITDLIQRHQTPIIAGGTFFYLDLLRGKQQPAPVPANQTLRTQLETESTATLFTHLQQKDPNRANTVDPHNRRRLIRSLEIINSLGKVPKPNKINSPYEWFIIGLLVEKEQLRTNYRNRLENWLDRGFATEVTHLLQRGIAPNRLQELGFEYTLMTSYLAKEITLTELKERFVQKNWQYAKRQLTWLKRDETINWFTPTELTTVNQRVKNFLQQPNS